MDLRAGVMRPTGAAVDRWLFAPGPGVQLWVIRSGLALLFGVRLAIGNHHELGGQPAALFRPQLLWRWLDAMPSTEVIVVVQAIGVLGAAIALASRRSRVPLIVAWTALVFVDGLLAARGKIMHNDLLALMAAVPILMGPVDAAPGDRDPEPRFGWPARAALVVVAFAYFFSGLAKLISSGPGWALSDNLQNILFAATLTDRPPTVAPATFVADHALLAQAVAAGALLIEVGFITVLWQPRWRPWFAAAAVGLHTGIWLTLGLDYWSWVVTVVLVLVDWGRVAGRLDPRRHPIAAEP